MSEPDTIARRAEQATSIVDRVVQIRWALVVVSFVLAADSALAMFWHQSLLNFRSDVHPVTPIGAYLLFAGAYVFAMAAAFPFVQACVQRLLWEFRWSVAGGWLFGDLKITPTRGQYRRGLVRVGDARDDALTEKDSFWAARLDAFDAAAEKRDADSRVLAQVSFSCGILLLINVLLAAPGTIATVLGDAVLARDGVPQLTQILLVLIGIILLLGPWLGSIFAPLSTHAEWIHHPALAARKLDQLKKNAAEFEPSPLNR